MTANLVTFGDALDHERQDRTRQRRRERGQRWRGRYTVEAVTAAAREFHTAHGRPPSRRDWSHERDPEHRWPRSETVDGIFRNLARAAGRRAEVLIDPRGAEEHRGLSGWAYMLELAGLPLATAADQQSTRSRRDEFGRNRQMVTAGAHLHPHVPPPHAGGQR